MIANIAQDIQYILSPAIMVSSAALMLLGLQNKDSNLANRFRSLNQEKRNIIHNKQRERDDEERLGNLIVQIDQLFERATYVKNAIILCYSGIVCFITTSILIFFDTCTNFANFRFCHILIFLLGLFFILIAANLMIKETLLFYKILWLEKKSK